jgi:hypothetical protein
MFQKESALALWYRAAPLIATLARKAMIPAFARTAWHELIIALWRWLHERSGIRFVSAGLRLVHRQ